MNWKQFFSVPYLFFFICISATTCLASQVAYGAKNYIQITKRRVNIRFAPTISSPLIAKANRGDIFELKGEKRGWYEIHLFSGDWRYVHKSLARESTYSPEVPNSRSLRRQVFKAWVEVEAKVQREADRRYPPSTSLKKNIEYSRILADRYKLGVAHKFEVQPPIYRRIA
ncbi:SH3 domain-containing protein, partial [Acidobacteria bacterium AH-259-A15]|nr:SH3 domain-containing protein [Acidobacteria bacterium AH-259-A15]